MIDDYGEHMESLKSICEKNESLEKFIDISSKLKDTDYFNFRWPYGESLLHWAASGGNNDICKYLLDLGSYVNAENIYGCNPIFYASSKEKVSTVKLLIDYGAHFDAKSVFSGGTPYNPNNNSTNLSSKRLEIMEIIKKYQTIKSELCKKSSKLEDLIKTNTKNRDRWEFEFRKYESQYGNKTSQGYWGLPNSDEYQKFKPIKKLDEDLIYIFKNKEKWCYYCCKINLKPLRCSRCKEVYYCSVECQKNDFKNHKKICIKI